jgi:hypothetical protein
MNEYQWVPDARFKGDANAIGLELERLHSTGGVTPEAIVAVAKSKRSILHPLIYDGTTAEEALDKYRLGRARVLIKSLTVVVHEGERETCDVRAFHRVVTEDGRQWVPADVAAADPLMSEQVRRRLVGEMRGLKTQLDQWGLFTEVSLALEEALAA